jgi:8-oxo-dGTP diphosphatase
MSAVWTRIGAYVLCRDRGRVLLTRFSLPGHPDAGRWTLPGGRVEWGESAEDAARRELAEETGLATDLGPVLGIYSRWYSAQEAFRGEPGHHFGVVFSSTSVTGELRTTFEGEDSTDMAGWFSPAEMRELPLVPLATFALDFIE